MTDKNNTATVLKVGDREYEIFSLDALKGTKVHRLPYSLKILLENLLRHEDGRNVRAADIEFVCDIGRVPLEDLDGFGAEIRRRDDARAIAGVDTGFLDVFHHRADEYVAGVVADRVDIDLGRVFEEPIDENWALSGKASLATE